MTTQFSPALASLLQIPQAPAALFPRGGAYDPARNVWICHEFAELIAESSPEQRDLFERFAELALAAGQVHRQQILDSQAGKIWPQRWIDEQNGAALIDFSTAHPTAALPYACLNDRLEVTPFSVAYRHSLAPVRQGIEAVLASPAPSAVQQAPYLHALHAAYTHDPARQSDLAWMNRADAQWVDIPTDVPYLLMCEFSESYSDPLKRLVVNQPDVAAWATDVTEQTGLGPWRFFFEFRVLGNLDSVLHPAEIVAIRATNRQLYRDISDFLPSEQVKTEFRQSIITAGHGANPPKSAKNYPNQTDIRRDIGYRNIIFANQVQEKMRKEVIPALRAAIPADWAQADWFADTMIRANALSVVAHEETHPWATFGGIPWLEELKCDILGLYSILQIPTIHDEIADLIITSVASDLLLHRYHTYLQSRGDSQFDDYHTGGTIWLTHLYRGGFFQLDGDGKVIDVVRAQAVPLLESFARRIMTIKTGATTHTALYDDLFDHAMIYTRFHGWAETQAYFEQLWAS